VIVNMHGRTTIKIRKIIHFYLFLGLRKSSQLYISNLALPSLWFGSVPVASGLNVRKFESKR
jgi:hypothetical protein